MSRKNRRSNATAKAAAQLHLQTTTTEHHRTKKNWTIHDLRPVAPMNESQRLFMSEFIQGQNVLATGSAGTGKTYLACYLALQELLGSKDSQYDKIIIIRSAVPSRDIGFMPGTLEEKTAFYETPYEDIFRDLLRHEKSYANMKAAGKLQFMVTSFVRGLTFDNAIIIVDECQSATFHELYSVVTRVGENSRLILCGDSKQDDLHAQRGTNRSGISDLAKVMSGIDTVSCVQFTENDIVRSGFVKEFIINCQKFLPE